MVERAADAQIGRVFHALAHDARRDMLARLAAGDLTVSDLAGPLNMTLAAASKHIKVLEEAGLLRRSVVGRTHVCRLNAAPLAVAHEWLSFYERFWSDRLEVLAGLIESMETIDAQEVEKGNNDDAIER